MYYAVEDQLSEALLLQSVNTLGTPLTWSIPLGRQSGETAIWQNITSYETLSEHQPVVVLLDLDRRDCAITYRNGLSNTYSDTFAFRIVETEAEAWLLADYEGFAEFLGASVQSIRQRRDWESIDAKEALLNAVDRFGSRDQKAGILPATGSGSKVGFEYNQMLINHVKTNWSADRARINNNSLDRAMNHFDRALQA